MIRVLVLFSLLISSACGSAGTVVDEPLLERVVVIGASASAGFTASLASDDGERRTNVNLGHVVDSMILAEHDPVEAYASALFFTNPRAAGAFQMERVVDVDPTLVVGVDYLFWFGYGRVRIEPGDTEVSARLALLEEGFDLLDRIEVPVLVGDFPDMSDAVGLMLSPVQMPSQEALDALNRRVREWAGARDNVTLVALGGFLNNMRVGEGDLVLGENRWPRDDVPALLGPDKLHPSALGLVATGMLVAQALDELGVEDSSIEDDRNKLIERMRADLLTPMKR